MRSFTLLAILVVTSHFSFAQVGIGTTSPDASAQLDVSSTSKGLLPPRVALSSTTDVSTISSPATGLVVYNSATANDVTPGYYYYTGTAWIKLITGIKVTTEALGTTLSAASSGNIYFSQNSGYPVVPENLPDGFSCEIINYSNFANGLTTLASTKYYTKTSGGNTGVTTLNITSGGTIRLNAVTVGGTKRYYVTGDYQ